MQQLRTEKRRARRRTHRAAAALPEDPRLPRFPALEHYSSKQKRYIRRRTKRAARRIARERGATGAERGEILNELYREGGPETRRALRIFRNVAEQLVTGVGGGFEREPLARALQEAETERRLAQRIEPKDPELERVQVASVPVGDLLHSAAAEIDRRAFPAQYPGLRVLKAPVEIARATAEDPTGVAAASARSLKESIVGIPAGVKAFVEDPEEAVEAIGKDYGHRYGPLLEGDTAEFRRRVQEESGVTPFVLDAATVGAGVGQAGGLAARTSAMARLGRAGRALHAAASEPRPMLRLSGDVSRPQRLSRNLFVAAGQRAVDRRRATRHAAQVRDAARKGRPGPMLDPRPGEVVPLRNMFTRPLHSRQLRRDVGEAKGRTLFRLREEQAREYHQGAAVAIASLTRTQREALVDALRFGLPGDPDRAVAILRERRRQIVAARERTGYRPTGRAERKADELARIDRLIERAGEIFTPEFRRVLDVERRREKRLAGMNPALRPEQALMRRYSQQGELLGVERRADAGELIERLGRIERKLELEPGTLVMSHGSIAELLPEQRLKAARELEARAARRRDAARERLETARREQARAKEAVRRSKRPDPAPLTGLQLVADPRQPFGVGTRRHPAQRLRDAQAAVRTARAELADAQLELKAAREVRRELKARPGRREHPRLFVARVREAARERGLVDPAYVRSESRLHSPERFSDFAAGTVAGIAPPKRYTGRLFRLGMENADPLVHASGVARNIKYRHQWAHVADTAERHSFKEVAIDGERVSVVDKTPHELDVLLRRANKDPRDFGLYQPKQLQAYRHAHDRALEDDGLADVDPFDDDLGDAAVYAATRDSLQTLEQLKRNPDAYRRSAGWQLVPKAVMDEILEETNPSGRLGRGFEIAKGKASRVLLGTNPSWLAFQVAANAFLTGLARTGPIDFAKAQAWWRRLPAEQQRAVAPYLGVGHFQGDVRQTRLGAAANGDLVNAWRALKQTTAGKAIWPTKGKVRAGHLNPLDWMFRADNAQNNAFRKAVLYSQAKRDAYRELGKTTGRLGRLQAELKGLLTLGPEEQIRRVVDNRAKVERHAEYVNDFLGDYLTYTARERRWLGRSVMFYGFLRYSLRFTFWTMPTRHPVMASIFGQLGRLGVDEVRELLGGDELPWALGRIYWTDDGQLQAIDLGRMNPALNALTQLEKPTQAIGVLPPMVGFALNQLYGVDYFTGRPFQIRGETPGVARAMFGRPIGLEDRGRILLDQTLSLLTPYRQAEDLAEEGRPYGTDSLLWSPRPTMFKDPKIRASIRRQHRRAERLSLPDFLLQQNLPMFFGRRSYDREIARSIRERERTTRRRRRSTIGGGTGGGFGGGLSSGGGGFGGGLSSDGGF